MLRTLSLIAALGLAAPVAAQDLRFAVTDVEGAEALQQEFGAFETALEEVTGLDIELFPISNRTAAVEAMRAGQVDLVLTGPAEYVVMNELAEIEIVTAWQRPDYFSVIAVLADGPIRSTDDLRGEIITFGAVGSTSQHLGPAQALADLGLNYAADYQPQIINRNVATEALIRGDVAAVGMNHGHLGRIRDAFPETAFTVVARGRDLPNDILVARADLDDALFETVRDAFLEYGPALMAGVLEGEDNQKYAGGFFLNEVRDADYEYVRDMYRTIGVESFDAFVGD
ncbi:PhnD/SsuA/transferrin family substrate-binding protein [Pontivivens ytuae]|uniref:PhnD/SsuA/transferrin family substrate-binding protein n=1 Tax=Pontivivens ytuae TaxID=2789856 RepID=A0A7S9QCB5_9RHOB|nr:PhnD/SsuA/transferrin family substrate-binding protein [Pontivivens ytuae]QPH53212.1 PhnD/SsuA/transferrin family substrate-binding protein [Pontivivens ytuae]